MIKLKDIYEAIIAEQGATMNKAELKRHYDKLEKLRKYMEDQGDHMVVYPDLPNTVMNAKLINKEQVNEISGTPYPYKKDYWSKEEITYTFAIDDETTFDVNVFPRRKNAIEVDFQSNYSWETTNRNTNVFKIFTTIKEILLEIVAKLNRQGFAIDTIIYDAATKKAGVYKALINSVYPNAQYKKNQFGSMEVKFT